MPAIMRTIGDMPLVAAAGRFVEALPGSTPLPAMVEPLGHDVNPLATPGLVVAHARQVEENPGAVLPPPLQRFASRGSHSTATVDPPDIGAGPEPEASPSDAPAASQTVQGGPPIRSMPAISQATIRMPDRPLTSAAVAARSAVVQRATGAGPSATIATPVPGGRGMRKAPSADTGSGGPPSAPPTVSRQTAPARADASMAAAPKPDAPLRPGLGAPLFALPPSARPVGVEPSRRPAASSSGKASPAAPIGPTAVRSAAQRAVAERADRPAAVSGTPAREQPGTDEFQLRLPALPILPVARSAAAPPPAGAPPPAQRQAPPAPEIRPLAAARSLRPVASIQRSALAEPGHEAAEADLPTPWWVTTGDSWPSAGASPSPSAMTSAGPESSPTVSRAAASPVATWAALSGPTRTATGLPAATPAATPVVARAVQRAPLALARVPTAPVQAAPVTNSIVAGGGLSSDIVVQQSRASSAPPPAAQPHLSAQPVIQRIDGASPPVPPPSSNGSDGPSERDLEQLAQALFSRIRGRIRTELIHDREARGLSFDNV